MGRDEFRAKLRLLGWIMAGVTVAGILFGFTLAGEPSWRMTRSSILTTFVIGLPILSWEIFYVATARGARFRRWPFLGFLLARIGAWMTWVFIGTLISGTFIWTIEEEKTLLTQADTWWTILFSFGVGFVVVSIMALNRLFGRGVLVSILLGRYHRPRAERRAFLFLDLLDSTATAEQIGAERFLALMNRFAYDVDETIQGTGGAIHGYVGDLVIVTWPLSEGSDLRPAAETVFALRRRLARDHEAYERAFGHCPGFRAALHAGPVVVGEIGDRKREVVLLGDTVNTTSRIEHHCRQVGRDFLVSGEAMERIHPSRRWQVDQLAPMRPRGSSREITLFAISERTVGV